MQVKSPPAPMVALVAPDVGMERVARLGAMKWPLLVALFCSLLAGGAAAYRVDARDATLQQLEMTGQLKQTSDRQIEEQTKGAERAYMVKRTATAVVAPLFSWLANFIGLAIVAWFLRARARWAAVRAVAAVALLPGAILNVLSAAATLRRWSIPPEGPPVVPSSLAGILAELGHPLMGPWAKLGSALDFFGLWAAVLLAFGLAPATGISRTRALVATLTGWVLWRLFSTVALGG